MPVLAAALMRLRGFLVAKRQRCKPGGRCMHCKGPIGLGYDYWYVIDWGSVHPDCFGDWAEERV